MRRDKMVATKTRRILENPLTYIVVLFLTLLANLVHAASEYNILTGQSGYLAYAILLTVDLAVILFAYNGNRFASRMFAGFIFLINLSYFFREGDFSWRDIQDSGMALIFSAIFSVSIYIFSEEFVRRVNTSKRNKRNEGNR
tara:strand:+ start:28 stop:453 length:426 start_codon:yes stop_codon:yes gene_type:complete